MQINEIMSFEIKALSLSTNETRRALAYFNKVLIDNNKNAKEAMIALCKRHSQYKLMNFKLINSCFSKLYKIIGKQTRKMSVATKEKMQELMKTLSSNLSAPRSKKIDRYAQIEKKKHIVLESLRKNKPPDLNAFQ